MSHAFDRYMNDAQTAWRDRHVSTPETGLPERTPLPLDRPARGLGGGALARHPVGFRTCASGLRRW